MATLFKAKKLIDLGNENFQDIEIRNARSVVRGCQPQPLCEANKCLNGCKCSPGFSHCDNTWAPFHGPHCNTSDIGFKFFVQNVPGQVTLRYEHKESTTMDKISFGFITCSENGLLAKITAKGEYIKLYLESGRIVAEYLLGGVVPGKIITDRTYNDERMYTVNFIRNGLQGTLTVISPSTGQVVERKATTASGPDNQLNELSLLEIGSEHRNGQYFTPFKGMIFGFKYNGYVVFPLAQAFSRLTGIKTPGTEFVSSSAVKSYKCDIVIPLGDCGPGRPECKNFGVCQNNRCNCTLTAYRGTHCEDEPIGHYYGFTNWKSGLALHEYPQGVTTMNDYFAIGVMTYEPNGTIFRVESTDGTQYYDVRLVNGKAQLEYRINNRHEVIVEDRITLHSEDDVYHVIRMNRTGEKINFFVDELQRTKIDTNIAGVPFRNQQKLMSGGMTRPNRPNHIEDPWYGILGGLYYNGKFLYHMQFDGSTYRKFGDLANAPHPFALKKRPKPICEKCYGGRHTEALTCDCLYTGKVGPCCNAYNDQLWGFHLKKYDGDSVLIYNGSDLSGKGSDEMSVSFQTARGWGDGQLFRIENKDGTRYLVVEIVDTFARVRHNLDGTLVTTTFDAADVQNQGYHTIRINRNGATGTSIDLVGVSKRTYEAQPNSEIFDASVIYVGGKYVSRSEVEMGHYGIIWGVDVNGVSVVDKARGVGTSGGSVSIVDEGESNFNIVKYPWPALCDKGTPGCPGVPVPPLSPGGNGAVIPEIGLGVVPVTKPVVTSFLDNPAALVGAIMGGLIFSSAIVFAAAGMKPGFLALSKKFASGMGGYVPVSDGKANAFPVSNGGNYLISTGMAEYAGAGGGSQAGSRSQYEESYVQESVVDGGMVAGGMNGGTMNGGTMNGGGGYNAFNSSSSYYRNETLENQHAGYGGGGGGSTIGGYGAGRGYAGSVAGGSIAGSVYGFGTVTNPDQAFITLSEDIAVDNVVLTADGRYVVTGSNLGPPQVWNTTVSFVLFSALVAGYSL